MTDHGTAELVARTRQEIAEATTANRFAGLLEREICPRERLSWLAVDEYRIVGSDRRSFALPAAGFAGPPSGELFLGLAQGEVPLLGDFAAALGKSEEHLMAYESRPLARPAFCTPTRPRAGMSSRRACRDGPP